MKEYRSSGSKGNGLVFLFVPGPKVPPGAYISNGSSGAGLQFMLSMPEDRKPKRRKPRKPR